MIYTQALLIISFISGLYLWFFFHILRCIGAFENIEIEETSTLPLRISEVRCNNNRVDYQIQARFLFIWKDISYHELPIKYFPSLSEENSSSKYAYGDNLLFTDYQKAQDFLIEYDFNRERIKEDKIIKNTEKHLTKVKSKTTRLKLRS